MANKFKMEKHIDWNEIRKVAGPDVFQDAFDIYGWSNDASFCFNVLGPNNPDRETAIDFEWKVSDALLALGAEDGEDIYIDVCW